MDVGRRDRKSSGQALDDLARDEGLRRDDRGPGAQRVLKVTKTQGADGSITTSREDIYGGKIVPFVPFTKLDGDKIVGTHNR